MSLSVQLKLFKEQFQFFLRVTRWQIDFVLAYSVTAAVLFILLRQQMLKRIVIADMWEGHYHGRALLILLREDMLYLAVLTILCLWLCTRFVLSTGIRTGVIIAYVAIVFISLLFLSVNVELAPMYSTQLDYSLLKFSGIMSGSRATLLALIPSSFLLNSTFVCTGLLAALCVPFLTSYQRNRLQIRRLFSIIVAGGLLTMLAGPMLATADLDKRESQNSLSYFLTSIVNGPRLQAWGTGELSASVSSNAIVSNVAQPIMLSSADNVLIIVLESVGAEYFELLSENGLLPTLSDIMSRGVYFKNSYVTTPVTAVSLVAMLTSTGPLPDYKIVTLDYPRAKFTTLYDRFKSKGFATAFFWSADSGYIGIDNFLQDRGIDLIQDYRHRACPESRSLVKTDDAPPFMFSADICTASSLLNWIDENHEKPFLATLWTEQTHYPYSPSSSCMKAAAAKKGRLHPEGVRADTDWLLYAAALCDTDRMIAHILSGLRERKLFENTLVVIVGDHGEAFGQHDSFIHGSEIFEEDVRVPLLISAGHFLAGRVDGRLASHLDIAPTIATAFGINPSDQWEGNDLLGNRAPRRVYFRTGWGNYKIGYREANSKYIYDVVRQELSTYDLASDAHEVENIAGKDHGEDAEAMSLIRQWYMQRTKFANTLH